MFLIILKITIILITISKYIFTFTFPNSINIITIILITIRIYSISTTSIITRWFTWNFITLFCKLKRYSSLFLCHLLYDLIFYIFLFFYKLQYLNFMIQVYFIICILGFWVWDILSKKEANYNIIRIYKKTNRHNYARVTDPTTILTATTIAATSQTSNNRSIRHAWVKQNNRISNKRIKRRYFHTCWWFHEKGKVR